MRSIMLTLALTCAALAACASSPTIASRDALAPPPFTADQIRAATPDGRTWVFRMEGGHVPMTRRWGYTAVDAEGAMVLQADWYDGQPAPATSREAGRVTWAQIADAERFPAKATTIEDATITVPAGTFACRLYTVRDGGDVMRYWFAKDLPGLQIRYERTLDGELVDTMVLLEHIPGG